MSFSFQDCTIAYPSYQKPFTHADLLQMIHYARLYHDTIIVSSQFTVHNFYQKTARTLSKYITYNITSIDKSHASIKQIIVEPETTKVTFCCFIRSRNKARCLKTHYMRQIHKYRPAAKCRGVDFRPAMSLAFTFTESTSLFTRDTSPFRQASNSSLNAPPAPHTPSPGLVAPEPGLWLPAVALELMLLQLELPGAVDAAPATAVTGEGRSGEEAEEEAAADSIVAPPHSAAPVDEGLNKLVDSGIIADGDSGGGDAIKAFRGDGCRLLCWCCEDRRGTAIFPPKLRLSTITAGAAALPLSARRLPVGGYALLMMHCCNCLNVFYYTVSLN